MRTMMHGLGAALLSVAFVVLLQVFDADSFVVSLISNGGQLLAAVLASVCCAFAARRHLGSRGVAWLWLSAGTGCWAAGQAVWSFYEVVLAREVPFPSLADVGFLAFPLVAGVGLVVWLGAQNHQITARGRDLMDGVIVASSLFVLSWVTVMGPLVSKSEGSRLALALSLAYPVGDVILATLVLIALVHATNERTTLALLAVGLGGFALADSLFSYMTTSGTYSSADLVSNSGWVFGFLFVAAAALSAQSHAPGAAMHPSEGRAGLSWLWLVLPYIPWVAAGVALSIDLLAADSTPLVDLVLGAALVLMVLSRQFLAMVDNQRLLLELARAGEKLEHQASHDGLTGLPNRGLFAARLDQALLRPTNSVSVMFCDLDHFKAVNDEMGHEAGDLLLLLVAQRLLTCVRATDTVARLGGDEFAILLEDAIDPAGVADRVVASMNQETRVLGRQVRTSISIGLAHQDGTALLSPTTEHRPKDARPLRRRARTLAPIDGATIAAAADRGARASILLRAADTAMYAAKSAGKGRAVLAIQSDQPLATSSGKAAIQ